MHLCILYITLLDRVDQHDDRSPDEHHDDGHREYEHIPGVDHQDGDQYRGDDLP